MSYRTLRQFQAIENSRGYTILEETLSDDSKAYSVTNSEMETCLEIPVVFFTDGSFIIDCYNKGCAYKLMQCLINFAA